MIWDRDETSGAVSLCCVFNVCDEDLCYLGYGIRYESDIRNKCSGSLSFECAPKPNPTRADEPIPPVSWAGHVSSLDFRALRVQAGDISCPAYPGLVARPDICN